MTPEQLASPELATWREQEAKHTLEMITMNQEEINATKAHIKKTHKGEVEIDDDDLSTLENSAELKVEKDLPDSNTSSSTLLLDTTDEHRIHLFDLNCRICTGKMAPPGEPPRRETPAPLVSTTSIVQAVAESSIPSPTPMDIVTSASSPDSATVTQPPVSPSVLGKTPKKVPAVWKGFVMMQNVAKFGTSAYRVSGPCDDLLQLLPDTLHVQGRIAHEQVWDYLLQLKSSTSREVCVIRYEASSDDEKLSYVSLYSYFYSRKRCGVVSNCYTGVKDMYLVPLASHQAVPPELLPFDGPGLDEPRPHMLLGVIVRAKAVFKRPRALSQRSLSPPSKRRTSSASVETNSSDGGTVESPASKRGVLSELHDSPPADIDDIVFQYNTTQAKMASKESKDSPAAKASPASETSTPSMTSSSGAVMSPLLR
ncbi:Death-inducer obliterator 1 [Desmophyllum pertusum]|uniref:Death-inducer obliterator 1 n=1 Tax=Desmophyllum pertusum TaxID=174260 RepID=A0A9W9YML4_9CNID|nr:Death-inducer obliterator 1 [Desmophyllum pertusum]